MYHNNKEFVDKWIEAIKDSVILVDLKEDYMIAQMIGKGNFAKVHLCKRKSDDRTFALKSVEKTLIRKSKRNSVSCLIIFNIYRVLYSLKLISFAISIMNTLSSSMRFMKVINTFTWSSNTWRVENCSRELNPKDFITKKMPLIS